MRSAPKPPPPPVDPDNPPKFDPTVPTGLVVIPRGAASTLFVMNELGLTVYGRLMSTIDPSIDKNKIEFPEEKLEIGEIIAKKYTVEKRIGKRTYLAVSATKRVVMHLEHAQRSYDAPNLKRKGIAYLNIQSRLKNSLIHQKHFLQMYWCSLTHDMFQYLLEEKADCSVRDLLSKVLQNRPLSRSSALQISAQMLQGIHDFHLAGYTHRDIRPHNFFVGSGRNYQRIYISGFDVCYDRFKQRKKYIPQFLTPPVLPKVANVTARFQSRAYHVGDRLCRMDDIESWLYTSIVLFSRYLLPWRDAENERRGFTSKCRLANGDYNLGELEPFFRPMLNAVRYRTLTDDRIDFPFYAEMLESMAKAWKITGKELLDWKVNLDGKVVAAQMEMWNKNNNGNLASQPITASKASVNATVSTSNVTGGNKKRGKLAARGGEDSVERTQETQEGSNALPVKPKNNFQSPKNNKKKLIKVDEVEQTQETDTSNANAKVSPGRLLNSNQKPTKNNNNNIIKSPKLMNKKKEASVDDATQDPEDLFPAINNKGKISAAAIGLKPTQQPKKNATVEDRTQEAPASPVPKSSPGIPAAVTPLAAVASAKKKEAPAAVAGAPGAKKAAVVDEKEKKKSDKSSSGSETAEDFVTPPSKASTKNAAVNF